MSSNDEVDGWIAQLMQCKPLSETEVKKLCDKVGFFEHRAPRTLFRRADQRRDNEHETSLNQPLP